MDVFSRFSRSRPAAEPGRDPFITALAGFRRRQRTDPFRQVNGHPQRALFSQLAYDAWHHIAW